MEIHPLHVEYNGRRDFFLEKENPSETNEKFQSKLQKKKNVEGGSEEKGKGEVLFMGEVDEWVKERVRENRVHAFHHCYMLHHAHIHKSLCFVPNPNISGQMERVRELGGG